VAQPLLATVAQAGVAFFAPALDHVYFRLRLVHARFVVSEQGADWLADVQHSVSSARKLARSFGIS
jgi:hypothetical protein